MSAAHHLHVIDPMPVGGSQVGSLAELVLRVLEFADVRAVVVDEGGAGVARATRSMRADASADELSELAQSMAMEFATERTSPDSPVELVSAESGRRMSVTRVQAEGHAPLCIAVDLTASPERSRGTHSQKLTPRQQAVVDAVVRGASVREAAESLGIAVHTARRHLEAAHARLRVTRRAQLVRQWVERAG
jgi:DNA-binding CsgD family transcriptional regulator